MKEPTTLDELFNAAVRHIKKETLAKSLRPKKLAEAHINPQALYANEKNWIEGRGIALIDATTKTLVGNFQEWNHISVEGARKLIRVNVAIKISATEEVAAEGFYKESLPRSQHNTETLIKCNVELAYPEMQAKQISLRIISIDPFKEAILRVELENKTVFAEGDSIMLLPAGINVLPVITYTTKLIIRKELSCFLN